MCGYADKKNVRKTNKILENSVEWEEEFTEDRINRDAFASF